MPSLIHRNDPPGMRRCPGCKRLKPISNFWKNASKEERINCYCKPCCSARERRRKAKNGEYSQHVRIAHRRGWIPLSREEYKAIIKLPCVMGGGKRPEVKIGPDRINSALGYPGNSQPMCPFHNMLKNWLDDEQLIAHVKAHPEKFACRNGHPARRQPSLPLVPEDAPQPEHSLPLFDQLKAS